MYHPSLISSLPMYDYSLLSYRRLVQSFVDFSFIKVAQWMFRNNGITFRDEDWTRLRKIGE